MLRKNKPLSFISLSFSLATLLGAGCGDDETPCETYGNSLCEQACDCTEGEECVVGDPNSPGVTFSFDGESDCKALYVGLGCSVDSEQQPDFDACIESLDQGSCQTDPEGNVFSVPTCE